MATVSKGSGHEPSGTQESTESTPIENVETQKLGSPISNEAYDVITALHAKLKGLAAYRKYAEDAKSELWQQLTQVDLKAVSCLVDELEQIVKEGKLRMQEPSGAH